MARKSFEQDDTELKKSPKLIKILPEIATIITKHPTLNFENTIAAWIGSEVFQDYQV